MKIPNEALLLGGNVLIDILVNLFQAMYRFGFVPKSFGESHIVKVPKERNIIEIQKCRPISLICVIRKLFDIYILGTNSFSIPKKQFGFQKHTNIHDALMHVESKCINSNDPRDKCTNQQEMFLTLWKECRISSKRKTGKLL